MEATLSLLNHVPPPPSSTAIQDIVGHKLAARLRKGSTDRVINSEVAHLVVEHSNVAGVGDCLFGSELSQTFRYIEN